MTGPWQPNKPDHRDRRQDEASRLWAASHGLRPRRDPLESQHLTVGLAVLCAFLGGVSVGIIAAAFILGIMS